MKLLYLPEEDSGVVESEPANPKQARDLASQAYQVLHDWAIVPGTDENGTIDSYALMSWVKQARQLLKSAGRGEIGDDKIGMILSAAKEKKMKRGHQKQFAKFLSLLEVEQWRVVLKLVFTTAVA